MQKTCNQKKKKKKRIRENIFHADRIIRVKRFYLVKMLQYTALKVSKHGDFSCRYFPVFGLNKEIYGVNFCIQSEYRKIGVRKNSAFAHILRSDSFDQLMQQKQPTKKRS